MPTSVSHEYTSLSDLCSLLAYTDQHYWSVYAQLACNSHICHSAWSLTSREVMATVHACNSVPQNHPIYQYTKNGPWLAHIYSSLTLYACRDYVHDDAVHKQVSSWKNTSHETFNASRERWSKTFMCDTLFSNPHDTDNVANCAPRNMQTWIREFTHGPLN